MMNKMLIRYIVLLFFLKDFFLKTTILVRFRLSVCADVHFPHC